MAFEDKKGIVVASPFKLQAEALLDVRQQVDTIAERDRLVTLKAATAGLRVFVKENSTSYVYTGSKWDPLTTGAPYKHPTGDGNHHVPATGTTNSGKFLKAGATAGSESWQKIAASDITGLPTKLPNPQALKFTGAATATYDGSGAVTVNIPTTSKTNSQLTLQLNGGVTEGTNKFTFDGSAAKEVNITPASIGAAASSHTHPSSQITGLPTSLKNPYSLSIKTNGATAATYDGSAAKEVNITPSSIGAATSGHSHSVFKGASASAAGGTGFVPAPAIGEQSKFLRGDGTWQVVPLSLSALGVTASATELNYMKGVTSAVQTQLNGKASSSHTHNYAGSGSAGGSANSAVKLATARTINGISFDGTKNIDIPNNYSKQLTSEDLNELLTPGNYFGAGGNTVKNKPSSVDYFGLEVYRIASGPIAQKLHGNNNIIYYRVRDNASFGAWKKVYSAAAKPTAAEIGAAPSSHTHPSSQITGLPTKLPNPQALKFTGAATATYDGSGAVTVNIPTAQASPYALTMQFNGGTTEDTNKFTFNGSVAKNVNITPALIGAAAASHTHAASQITGLPTSLKNPYALTVKTNGTSAVVYDGSVSKEVNITASSVGAAAASHGHSTFKGATTSAAGGTGFVPTPGVGENNKYLRGDGTWQPISLTLSALGVTATASELNYMKGVTSAVQTQLNGKAAASHTHPTSQITGLPTKLPNPYALKFTGAATATYDGSGAVTVNIPTSSKTNAALTMQMNGGTTEDTNKFTFDGSAAKTVNITPALIGAAAASHTHTASQITGLPTSLKNPYALTVKTNGTAVATYDGSSSKEVNITPASIGAAAASHGHSVFKGATSSAAGGVGFVPEPGAGENTKYLRGDGTWQPISLTLAALGVTATATELNYMKGVTSAVQTQLNGKASSSHTHTASQITGLPTKLPNPNPLKFTGAATATYDGSGAVTVNIPTAQASPFALTLQMNGGTTEGTNKFTFNGGAAKTVNITPALIGAAAASHTHNYAGSGSAGGSANSAVKLATARTINGISFDGTKNIDIPNNYSKQLTSEDLNSLLTPGNYFAAGGNTVKNKPSSVEHFGLEVYKMAGGNIAQKLHGSDNTIYYRFHNGTSFNSWSEIYSSVNKPTPSEIGAAAASHTHNYAASSHTHPASQITGLPTSLKNPYALTVKTNGTTAATYDGSAAKEVNITPAAIGAAAKSHSHSGYAPTSHTHNYAGSSSAGGPANSAKKVDFPVGTVLWTTSSSATFFSSTCGGTWEVLGNIDTIINSSTTLTLYMHKKKAL